MTGITNDASPSLLPVTDDHVCLEDFNWIMILLTASDRRGRSYDSDAAMLGYLSGRKLDVHLHRYLHPI